MNLNTALLALAVGFVLAACSDASSTEPAATEAQSANTIVPVVLPQKPGDNPYIKDRVTVYEDEILILEDHKRNRLCYITQQRTGHGDTDNTSGISCGPLFPR